MFFRILSYLWLGLTLYLLLTPGIGVEQVVMFEHEDKVAHFSLFFNLTLLWHREIGINLRALPGAKPTLVTLFFGLILAATTEIAQYFIPHRGMDMADFAFNLLGVLVAILFRNVFEKRKQTLFK